MMLGVVSAIAVILGVAGAATVPKDWQDGRIVGGQDIGIEAAPHQVSLVSRGRGHTCGGAILSRRVVVTAAHCVRGSPASSFQVRVGSSFVSRGGNLLDVSRLVWHDGFSTLDMSNDIALLLLARDVEFSDVASPIEISEELEIEDGAITSVTGWGTVEEGGKRSEHLQEVLVPTVSQRACAEAYRPYYNITASMLCAGVATGGKDACQGDSGGPLTYGGRLAGVVSWGIGCARPGYPGVYTRLAALAEWIDEHIAYLNKEHADR